MKTRSSARIVEFAGLNCSTARRRIGNLFVPVLYLARIYVPAPRNLCLSVAFGKRKKFCSINGNAITSAAGTSHVQAIKALAIPPLSRLVDRDPSRSKKKREKKKKTRKKRRLHPINEACGAKLVIFMRCVCR